MSYKLELGEWNKIFAIPNSVVEKYIKLAKEDFIKVLLVLLAYAGNNLSEKEISEISGVSESNVADAIDFWAEHSVISKNDAVLSPAEKGTVEVPKAVFSDKPLIQKVIDAPKKEAEISVNKNIKIRTNDPVRLSGFELSKRIESADELKWLVSETERLFGRFLNQSEISVLVSMFDYAGLPADIIVMLIEYCISIDKANMRFIEKTAYSWADQGIDTHKAVEDHIKALITEKNNEYLVKSAFGIHDRNLTTKQKEFVSVWLDKWQFSIEMLKLAYEMCLDNTAKLSFPYINKILLSWYDKDIKTPRDVEENEKNRQNDSVNKTFDAQEFDGFSDYTVPNLSKKK
ncbi:MAG: DnaD domain protein [Oscillospiraceae bacterium]|nr:DnaD domain protein [Oscillospiraceae bacterium]